MYVCMYADRYFDSEAKAGLLRSAELLRGRSSSAYRSLFNPRIGLLTPKNHRGSYYTCHTYILSSIHKVHTHTYIYIHTYIHIYTHTCIHNIHAYMHTYILFTKDCTKILLLNIYMYVCMYVCMCV